MLANFFSYYQEWNTSSNILLGSTKYYAKTCAGYTLIFVTLKCLLKTQIFETKQFFRRKTISANFLWYYRV